MLESMSYFKMTSLTHLKTHSHCVLSHFRVQIIRTKCVRKNICAEDIIVLTHLQNITVPLAIIYFITVLFCWVYVR